MDTVHCCLVTCQVQPRNQITTTVIILQALIKDSRLLIPVISID